jgi:hypothetical protein
MRVNFKAIAHCHRQTAIIDLVYYGYADPTYWPIAMDAPDHEARFDNLDPTIQPATLLNLQAICRIFRPH